MLDPCVMVRIESRSQPFDCVGDPIYRSFEILAGAFRLRDLVRLGARLRDLERFFSGLDLRTKQRGQWFIGIAMIGR